MNLKGILVQPKQPIGVKNYEQPTCTLSPTFFKTAGGANIYVWFLYGPQKQI